MTAHTVRTDLRCRLGEGPLWVPRLNSLLWVDILGPHIHRLDLASGALSSWTLSEAVGWIVERAGRHDFLIGLKSGVAEFDLETGVATPLLPLEHDRPDNRLNDAKVDPKGVLWAGTKDDTDTSRTGALYRILPDLSATRADDGYGVTNGPTFSSDGTKLFHTDSAARIIYVFDLAHDRSLSNRRIWLRFEEEWGYPDGMTTDAEGCVWIAHWAGGRISRFSPEARLISQITLPCSNITSCVFAGAELNRMFVTSSTLGCEQEGQAGMLFEVDPGVRGLAPTPFAG